MTWYSDFSSSNVNRLGYDSSTEEVWVEFKKKTGEVTATWVYWRVAPADFDAIHYAESVGGAVNKFLVRGGNYSSRKA